MRRVVVVGASLAGVSAVRALRAEGFDGPVDVVGAEPHPPYDRPPLSKELLVGGLHEPAVRLLDDEETEALTATWHLGRRATSLDAAGTEVVLDDGTRLAADGVVVATGSAARRLPGLPDGLRGVHVLRTIEDAEALRADLVPGRRVVVVGGGFVGAEVASSARTLGLDVTVVEAEALPFASVLGERAARAVAGLHAAHGTTLVTGVPVTGLRGSDHVTGVALADDRVLRADVVVLGVGATPVTGWLAGSGVEVGDGVLCDAGCRSSLPQVVAAGDVARVPHGFTGTSLRVEHWTNALEQPTTAVRNLLAGRVVETCTAAPYVWSVQYGSRLQLAGHVGPDDVLEVVEGDLDGPSFLATYARDGRTTAVLALDQPRLFTRARKALTPIAL